MEKADLSAKQTRGHGLLLPFAGFGSILKFLQLQVHHL